MPYTHDIGLEVIRQVVFSDSSFVKENDHLFPSTVNPTTQEREYELMPDLVALGYTSVYASLLDKSKATSAPLVKICKEGKKVKSEKTDFSAANFGDVYEGHLGTLGRIKDKRGDAGLHKMLHGMYKKVYEGGTKICANEDAFVPLPIYPDDPQSKRLPAKVFLVSKGQAQGAVLPNKPRIPKCRQVPVQKCVAYILEAYDGLGSTKFGTIKVPRCLDEEAADHGYINKEISQALDAAVLPAIEILLERQPHPVMNLYTVWLKRQEEKRKENNQPPRKPRSEDFDSTFRTPIFPGDESLMQRTFVSIKQHLRQSHINVASLRDILYGLIKVVLRLVIVRVYLKRTARDDAAIWTLFFNSHLQRNWLDAERAYAACEGYGRAQDITTITITGGVVSGSITVEYDDKIRLPSTFRPFSNPEVAFLG
ncbi:hypothetical protein OF83DRAFT_1085366 [Amylostereum chailletii]|nr:hypothetical protein OF83DRAFT_1085366 [Amylostereum chailletii]